LATISAHVKAGEIHYCRFCGLPVAVAESHGTELECIQALRVEIERRGASLPLAENRGGSAKETKTEIASKLAGV
jgi:hypothetical protein